MTAAKTKSKARTKAKTPPKDPSSDDYATLRDWLKRNKAKLLYAVPSGAKSSTLEGWLINSTLFLVIVWGDKKGGWDIFTATDTVLTSETLSDAAKRLGGVP